MPKTFLLVDWLNLEKLGFPETTPINPGLYRLHFYNSEYLKVKTNNTTRVYDIHPTDFQSAWWHAGRTSAFPIYTFWRSRHFIMPDMEGKVRKNLLFWVVKFFSTLSFDMSKWGLIIHRKPRCGKHATLMERMVHGKHIPIVDKLG